MTIPASTDPNLIAPVIDPEPVPLNDQVHGLIYYEVVEGNPIIKNAAFVVLEAAAGITLAIRASSKRGIDRSEAELSEQSSPARGFLHH